MRKIILTLVLIITVVGCAENKQKRKGLTHHITSYETCVEVTGRIINTIPPVCEAPDGVIWVEPS